MHYNPFLADQYTRSLHAALYINTGYDPLYTQVDGEHTMPECLAKAAVVQGSAEQQGAWAVGYSEASARWPTRPPGRRQSERRWLDVETENSWSLTDLSLNQHTIQGIVDTLRRHSPAAVGIYSTGYQWHKIVGSLPVTGVRANWVATASLSADEAHARCGTGFSGSPVWLVQYIQGGFDTNYVC